jgi:hypothetical protein
MSATVTQTPGVSTGPILGGFNTRHPVTVAAGGIVPKGFWLAVGAGAGGGTAAFEFTAPGTTTAVACEMIASDGVSVTSVGAMTLYDYFAG